VHAFGVVELQGAGERVEHTGVGVRDLTEREVSA
jgi:hypothetical protein